MADNSRKSCRRTRIWYVGSLRTSTEAGVMHGIHTVLIHHVTYNVGTHVVGAWAMFVIRLLNVPRYISPHKYW